MWLCNWSLTTPKHLHTCHTILSDTQNMYRKDSLMFILLMCWWMRVVSLSAAVLVEQPSLVCSNYWIIWKMRIQKEEKTSFHVFSRVFQGEPFQPETFDSTVVCENPNNNLNLFKGYVWVSKINFTQIIQFHARLTTSRLHCDCLFCQIHTNEQHLFGLHICHSLTRETA